MPLKPEDSADQPRASDGGDRAQQARDGSSPTAQLAACFERARPVLKALVAGVEAGDALVVADFEGYMHWLDKDSGEVVARHKTDGDRVTNAPVASDTGVFVQTDGGKLIAFKSRVEQPDDSTS